MAKNDPEIPVTPRWTGQGVGYPKLAESMSRIPQFAIFRRFNHLNMFNLLRLQAELQTLEEELFEVQNEDFTSGDVERTDLLFDFQALRDSSETANKFQSDLTKRVAEVLKEYSKLIQELSDCRGLAIVDAALCQCSALQGLPSPSKVQYEQYQKWLTVRQECGVNFPREHENFHHDRFADDQVVFSDSNPEKDPITAFLAEPVVNWIHKLRGQHKTAQVDGVIDYSDRVIEQASNIISAAIFSLLPTVCILVLYFVQRNLVRLGLVIVFTTVFSMALAYFTSGKKHEIFAATAAFAAVEVVFIGSISSQQ